jgi:hypothetical protein
LVHVDTIEISRLRRHRHDPEVLLDQGPLGPVPPGRGFFNQLPEVLSLPVREQLVHGLPELRDDLHPVGGQAFLE